jgi:hypothetical protein
MSVANPRGVSSLKHQKERLDFGKKVPLSEFMNGLNREEYTKPWNDICKLGIIFVLHKYTPKRKLTMNEIGDIIGYRRRTIKNSLRDLMTTGILRTSIQKIDMKIRSIDGSTVRFYLNNPAFSLLTFEELLSLYKGTTFFAKCHNPNFSEEKLLEILNELYPQKFRFTGAPVEKNRIGNKYPDISHTKYPIFVEHFGSTFHKEGSDIKRIDEFKKMGYSMYVIWDYDDSRREEIKEELKEFIDNAIQNFTKKGN